MKQRKSIQNSPNSFPTCPKPCDHWPTFWGKFFQHGDRCVELNSWLLSTWYLMAHLIPTWRPCSVCLSLQVYWYCVDLKDTQRATDYLIGNTSCVVLNFAWSHWPGYSFIIHGNERKAAKWIHTCMHACISERFRPWELWRSMRLEGQCGRCCWLHLHET